MNTPGTGSDAVRMVERLRDATNAHDLYGIAACFTPDYRGEFPAHPQRSFAGRDQVRRNQEMILGFVPDLTVELIRWAVDGDVIWTEWEHRGTRADGSTHALCGPVIFGVRDGLASWARLYLEPVDSGGGDVTTAIHRDMAR